MKGLHPGTRSVHEILSTLGSAAMVADWFEGGPLTIFAVLASGLGLTVGSGGSLSGPALPGCVATA